MSPNAVSRPVAKTTAVAVPLTIDVPRKTRSGESGPVDRQRAAAGDLLGRQRLAGERRLLHVEVGGIDQARVGGDQVAGGEPDDVADDDLAARNLDPGAVAAHGRRRRDLLPGAASPRARIETSARN